LKKWFRLALLATAAMTAVPSYPVPTLFMDGDTTAPRTAFYRERGNGKVSFCGLLLIPAPLGELPFRAARRRFYFRRFVRRPVGQDSKNKNG
jgi:hypothetical protein